jgi:hypothetical protein
VFQALRGGGGNFGVCVEFQFAPAAVAGSIPVAQLTFDVKDTLQMLRVYAEFTCSRPSGSDGVSAYLFMSKHTNYVVVCNVAPYDGADATANLEALRELISPFVSLGASVSLESMTLPELNSMSDIGNAAGRMYAWSRSTFVPLLTHEIIEALSQARSNLPVGAATVEVMHLGGAIAKKSSSDSAFFHR